MKSSLLSSIMAALALAALGACSAASPAGIPEAPGGADDPKASDPGGAGEAPSPVAPPPGAASSVPTSGCGRAASATGVQSKTVAVGGASRHYQLVVPSGYDPSRPTRLVFVFHGLGGDGDQIRSYFGFEAEARGQALFVYPDGTESFQGQTAWAESDLGFFDAMVSEISAAYCVDAKRIFAAGHSFGAYMSNLVGCERGDIVRAIAPVSGGIVAGACKGPVAVWLAHGDDDSVVAQSEGIAARDHWLEANGCAATHAPSMPAPCVTYNGCTADHPVTWCSFPGGHYPPRFTKQAIWDFFQRL